METTTHIPWAADGVAMVQSSLRDEMVWRDCSAAADGLKPTATFGGLSATKDKNGKSQTYPRSPKIGWHLRTPSGKCCPVSLHDIVSIDG